MDAEESNHTWGIFVDGIPDDGPHVSFSGLVASLFKPAMEEMLRQRDPQLADEASRKLEEWEKRQGLHPELTQN